MNTVSRLRWRATLAASGLALLAACGGGSSGTDAAPDDGGGDPPAALSLQAFGTSDRTVSLAWTPVPGASGYTLERKGAGADWTLIATLGPDEHGHVDDGLKQQTAYNWRVAVPGSAAPPAEQAASTTANAPVVTAPAQEMKAPADSGSIDAAGGSVASADGGVQVSLPSGAVATPTQVTLQRTSNPLPEGLGDGVRVQVAGRPSQPLTLTLRYDATMDDHADGLGVALQRGDGSWLALPVSSVDKTDRLLTVSIAPALVERQAAGRAVQRAATVGTDFIVVRYLNLYLSPRQASVEPGRTQLLVPYAHTEGLPCWADPDVGCVPAMVLQRREIPFDNRKPGYTRSWQVLDQAGGSTALGTVTPRSGSGAVYQAPAAAPTPNPVAVRFVSRHDRTGRSVTLSSSIFVREPVWTMTVDGVLDGAVDIGFAYSAEAVWTREAGEAETYRANGTQSLHVIDIVCTATPSPDTVPLPPGALTIDRSVEPARYRLDVGSEWDTTISGTCPDGGFASVPARVPGRLVVEGTLSEDGRRIEGTAVQAPVTWRWSLQQRP